MNNIELDDTERNLLLSILNERLEALREEVQHTDTRAYKNELKVDRTALQRLADKIRMGSGMGAGAARASTNR